MDAIERVRGDYRLSRNDAWAAVDQAKDGSSADGQIRGYNEAFINRLQLFVVKGTS